MADEDVLPFRDPEFSDSVKIEIPTRIAARGLLFRLTRTRLAWLYHEKGITIVEAVLPEDPAGLAHLLRDVESWVVDYRIGSVHWHFDGRSYVMYAGVQAWLDSCTDPGI